MMINKKLILTSILLLYTALPLFAAPTATIQTNVGNVTIELNPKAAPKTVANFEQYVREGFYDGTIFHRVIDGFMIQGGGFTEDMQQKETREPIENEANNGLKNDRYTIAMARTMQPHSATAQFFINVKDNDFLNHTKPDLHGWGYAVFGKVIQGQDVVDQISHTPTGYQDVPKKPIIIKKITLSY